MSYEPTGTPGTPIPDPDDLFDDLGRRAGAALRHPAPPGGVEQIAHHARRTRTMTMAMAGGAAIALVIGGLIAVSGDDHDILPPSATTLAPAPTPTSAPTIPSIPTTSAAIGIVVPTTVEAVERTTIPSIPATAPGPEPVELAGTTVSYRWDVPSAITIANAYHPGGPPMLVVLADDGRAARVIDAFGDINGTPPPVNRAGEIRPLDLNGDPVTVESLHEGLFLMVGLTPDGGVVKIDPWSLSSAVWPHPGVVTDVATMMIDHHSWALAFWAIGYDAIDGVTRPVLWFDDGISAPDGQGPVAGTPTATQIATFDPAPGNPNPPLVADLGGEQAIVLAPEADGMSRLWTVRGDGEMRRTELRFDAPNLLRAEWRDDSDVVLCWIGDARGAHVVKLSESATESTLVWPTPVREMVGGLLLDATGAFIDVTIAGEIRQLYRDDAATDFFWYGDDAGAHLVVLHPVEGELVALGDPSGSGGFTVSW